MLPFFFLYPLSTRFVSAPLVKVTALSSIFNILIPSILLFFLTRCNFPEILSNPSLPELCFDLTKPKYCISGHSAIVFLTTGRFGFFTTVLDTFFFLSVYIFPKNGSLSKVTSTKASRCLIAASFCLGSISAVTTVSCFLKYGDRNL